MLSKAKKDWSLSCVHTEATLHQLSPYIGKLKSSIASDLLETYTKPGGLVVDPFCGAGTIPLEAASKGRNIFASDSSSYSILLTRAKLTPPASLESAIQRCQVLLNASKKLSEPNLSKIPKWIRSFYHPATLKEILNFITVSTGVSDSFYLACLMGILHHQRPGFLSYPSSHLVPYLRTTKFPKDCFPELYEYRDLESRLLAKINRAFKRLPNTGKEVIQTIRKGRIENITLPNKFDCVMTSPPYMNALDYERDNRLRLWFLNQDRHDYLNFKRDRTNKKDYFEVLMRAFLSKVNMGLIKGGTLILILGSTVNKGGKRDLVSPTVSLAKELAPSLKMEENIVDTIPDIRRTRKNSIAVREENIMIFRKK